MSIEILISYYSFYICSFSLFTLYMFYVDLLNSGYVYKCEFVELMPLNIMGVSIFYGVCNLVHFMEFISET